MYEFLAYQLADIKSLLFDIDSACRGIGGVNKPFDYNKLPSNKKNNVQNYITATKEQTEEQRLERHRRFFAGLKELAKPPQITEEEAKAPIITESKYDYEQLE